MDGEAVLGEEVGPHGLSIGEGGLSEDGFDDGVISMDGEGAVVEVVTPELEGLNEAEELFVIMMTGQSITTRPIWRGR